VRIFIAIPVHRQMDADFGICLSLLTMDTVRAAPHIDLAVVRVSSSILAQARTSLWRGAEDARADYLLFLDSDQTFPGNALLRLLARKLPVVGAHYPQRVPGRRISCGWALDGTPIRVSRGGMGVEEVRHLGLGLCLIDMKAAREALAAQAGREGRSTYYPLFAALPDPEGGRHPNGMDIFRGEDVYFFDKLRAAGLKVHVDHDLSAEVGHIGQHVFTF
jgi:hypothetical protein